MVINAPTSNIVSAAELAVTLILASLRNLSRSYASVKAGRWDRKQLTGVELLGKKGGEGGFGRLGHLVSQRLTPFDWHTMAHVTLAHPPLDDDTCYLCTDFIVRECQHNR